MPRQPPRFKKGGIVKIKISEVFQSIGQPTITYVRRDEGKYERLLSGALDVKGQLCLLTGPSKTGKTTLYKKVLEEKKLLPLPIRCDGTLSDEQFWRRGLEGVNFDVVKQHTTSVGVETSAGGKFSGQFGWRWLAGLTGEASVGIKSARSEGEIREAILANPSPGHLVPILKTLPVVLVVEDFHYLTPEVQQIIFQQWKVFVDEEVSVIVIGTTHHAIDIANANRDLLGRLCHIDIAQWATTDLSKILQQGLKHLGIGFAHQTAMLNEIPKESMGLPIIVQQVAGQIFADLGLNEVESSTLDKTYGPKLTITAINNAIFNVASTKYGQLQTYYGLLVEGARKRARKYNTYELVLATFAVEPLKFSLSRREIEERIRDSDIPNQQKPPSASVGSMLKALGDFQRRRKIELLEWRSTEQTLYIFEPAFLFYIRWREPRKPHTAKNLLALVQELLKVSSSFGVSATTTMR
jgi:AAA domain